MSRPEDGKERTSDRARQGCSVIGGLIPPAIVRKDPGHVGGILVSKERGSLAFISARAIKKEPKATVGRGCWQGKSRGASPVLASPEEEQSVRGPGGDWVGTGWGCPRTSDRGALAVRPYFPLDLP